MSEGTGANIQETSQADRESAMGQQEDSQQPEIFRAVESGDYQLVKELVRRNSNLEIRDAKGQTPLLLAVFTGHADIVQFLNDCGASLDARNADGIGVWEIATKNRDSKILLVLRERGAQVPKNLEAAVARMLKEFAQAESPTRAPNRSATQSTDNCSKSRAATVNGDVGKSTTRRAMSSAGTADQQPECVELLELATPQLYRRNLFRVLGLSINATPADVRRQQKRLEMQRKLGVNSSEAGNGALALNPPPTDEDFRGAMDRLNDPRARLLDEILWFWPSCENPADDAALYALHAGEIEQAAQFWMSQTKNNGCAHIAKHNLAVLHHLLALDGEIQLASGTRGASSNGQLADHWSRAYNQWDEIYEAEDFWSRVRDRIRELNDATLTTGFARRLQETLPKAILLINGKIALAAAERGDVENARRHSGLIRSTTKSGTLAGEVLRESLKPIRQRLKALCDAALRDSEKDPEHANTTTWNLLKDCKPLLEVVDAMIEGDDLTRQALHDDVANTVLSCKISYGNKTENWAESLALAEAALPVAVGHATREKIQSNIDLIGKLDADTRCFFCGRQSGSDDAAIKFKMHGDVHKVDTQNRTYSIRWKHAALRVPRCLNCQRNHQRILKWRWLGALVGIASAIGVGLLCGQLGVFDRNDNGTLVAVAAMIVSVIAGPVAANIWIKRRIGYKIKSRARANKYPTIRQRVKEGWAFGEDPTPQEKAAAPYTRAEWKFDSGGRYEGSYSKGRATGGWYFWPGGDKSWSYWNESGEQIAGRCAKDKNRWGTSMPKEISRLAALFAYAHIKPASNEGKLIARGRAIAAEMKQHADQWISDSFLDRMSAEIQAMRKDAEGMGKSSDVANCVRRLVEMYRLFSGRETDAAFQDESTPST